MAVGFKSTIADSLNNALLRASSYAGPAAIYAKLHTASPGAAGTTAPAGNTTRQAVTFAASSGGIALNSNTVTWTSVSTSETYAFVTLWDDPTAGNFLGSGAITANPVTAGDTATIAIGGISVSLNVAA